MSFLKMAKAGYEDPVVAELHAIRAKLLAQCGGDHRKLMQQVRERQKASDRAILSAPVDHTTEQSAATVGP
jgi:hypothetical protein